MDAYVKTDTFLLRMSDSNEPVCTFFKKRRNVQNLRKTENEDEAEKKIKLNTEEKLNENDSKSESESDDEKKEEIQEDSDNSDTDLAENLKELKRKFNKKGSHLTQSTKIRKREAEEDEEEKTTLSKDLFVGFKANKNQKVRDDMGATATYE